MVNPEPALAGSGSRNIAMLIYPGVAPLDVAGPLQVFGVANFLRKKKLYDVVTVAPTRAPVSTPVGIAFNPTCAMSELTHAVDTLLISGGGGPEAGTNPEILEWVRQIAPKVRRLGSVCTGAFGTRRRRAARRQARDHTLGVRGRACTAEPARGHRHGPYLYPRRQHVQLRRHLRRDRPGAGPAR